MFAASFSRAVGPGPGVWGSDTRTMVYWSGFLTQRPFAEPQSSHSHHNIYFVGTVPNVQSKVSESKCELHMIEVYFITVEM